MRRNKIGHNGRVVSFIDIGTNSVRLLVIRLKPNHSYTILFRTSTGQRPATLRG